MSCYLGQNDGCTDGQMWTVTGCTPCPGDGSVGIAPNGVPIKRDRITGRDLLNNAPGILNSFGNLWGSIKGNNNTGQYPFGNPVPAPPPSNDNQMVWIGVGFIAVLGFIFMVFRKK